MKKGDQLIYQPGIWQQLVTLESVGKESGAIYINTTTRCGFLHEFKVPTAEDLIRHQEIEITRSVIAETEFCSQCQKEINQGWIIEESIEKIKVYCALECGVQAGLSQIAFIRNAYHIDWSGMGSQAVLFAQLAQNSKFVKIDE